MNNLYNISKILVDTLIEKKLKITSMESCTGGYFLSSITNIENSSKVTDGGYVTYSNESKIKNGVARECIEKHGVYSKETATQMAKACKEKGFNKEKLISIGITGSLTKVDDNNSDSQVGSVCYSIIYADNSITVNSITLDISMNRQQMKEIIVQIIMQEIIRYIE